MSRPSIFTPELGKEICARIAQGESVRRICKDNEMPSASTVFYWLLDEDKKEFLEQYETARNTQAENMFEELLEIADVEEDIQKARLKIDTRKWYLSKVLPKKFGDKLQQEVEHKGKIEFDTMGELTNEQLDELIARAANSRESSEREG